MIRVLLVDDHAMVRAGLERLLVTTADITVVGSCGSGEEALAVLAEAEPDVVLLDVALPGMNGVETARVITARHPGVRILIISTFGDPRDVSAALDAGVNGYLLKDVEPEVLIAGIRSLGSGGMPLSPSIAARLVGSAAQAAPAAMPLTKREEDVLNLIVDGMSNKQIAAALGISEKTVKTYCGRMFRRLGVTDRTQAAVWAERHLRRRSNG
jgi:DNA-binding NarL/FixJ family response regulator